MKKILLSIVIAFISICSSAQDKGYEKSIEITNGIGILRHYNCISLGVGMVNGYRFNQHFALGVGVGIRFKDENKYLIPVYLRAKYNITKSKISPFVLVDGGYVFDLGEIPRYSGSIEGWAFEPQIGIDIKSRGKVVLNVGIGANYQIPVKKYWAPLYGGSNSRANKPLGPIPSFTTVMLHFGIKF